MGNEKLQRQAWNGLVHRLSQPLGQAYRVCQSRASSQRLGGISSNVCPHFTQFNSLSFVLSPGRSAWPGVHEKGFNGFENRDLVAKPFAIRHFKAQSIPEPTQRPAILLGQAL